MKLSLLFSFILFSFSLGFAQDTVKTTKAIRVTSAPKIDGILDDEVWKDVPIASDFIQDQPNYKAPATQRTEAKVIYDNTAIYISAFMYDSNPDSILHELGSRDDEELNADYFMVGFDTYNKLIDAYIFGVSASGIQLDTRFQDGSFDAVWQSAVKINEKGWCAEFRIPYSALRFPDAKEQNWRLEFQRIIRRRQEISRWTFVPKNESSVVKYFGKLEGISDIKPPLRLSLTPYVSAYYETAPVYDQNNEYHYANSSSYNAGAGIKYGLNESFTLDMTLLPDFGQVQSDNKVKNIGFQETFYEDYRPFFKEGTDLFNRGMFYTRRIGKTPSGFYSVPYMLDTLETIKKNPSQTKLLNATKLTGRTTGGTGIGIFNAVTDNTYAIVVDSSGKERKILTEPLTNYNAFVIDQQLKNSSSINFMNTNVIRDGIGYRDANVSALSFSLLNKKNTFSFNGEGGLSQLFIRNDSLTDNYQNQLGYKYYGGVSKISGTWQYGIGLEALSSTYNRNDMGYLGSNNFSTSNAYLHFNMVDPWPFIQRAEGGIDVYYSYNFTNGLRQNFSESLALHSVFHNFSSIWGGFGLTPVACYEFNEPRTPGRYSYNVEGYWSWIGFNTDSRKRIATEASFHINGYMKNNYYHLNAPISPSLNLSPRLRVSDKLSFQYSFNFNYDPNNLGYANMDTSGAIIYGERELYTYENTLTGKYIFKNDLSFSLNARHYWNTGEYIRYYTLLDDGMIQPNTVYSDNNNFSYNAFNIDAVFSWQFAPGSTISLVYKNAIEKDEQIIYSKFSDNFTKTVESPQTNSISFKVLYYLDYQRLRKKD